MTNDTNAFYFLASALSLSLSIILSFMPPLICTLFFLYMSHLGIHRRSKTAPLLGLFLFIYSCDFRLFMPLFHLHVEENTSVSFY